MKNNGFTLAEVLIALVVLGVVAAITVPTLIQNTQKKEYVSALKKAYSTLSQATQQIIMEEGSPKSSSEDADDGWAYSADSIYNNYKKHLNVMKDCGTGKGCFLPYSSYTNLNNTRYTANFDASGYYRKMILADGMQIAFNQYISKTCQNSWKGVTGHCAHINIDINGAKKPNKVGRDIFQFIIKEDGLHPAGCDTNEDVCNTSLEGNECSCKVLRENAMNY